ncbi:MAG: peptidase M20 [Gammaproteobacteria bacterium]|nr:MAG: peptidase M20 [Gammaproteobacteria bacterium]
MKIFLILILAFSFGYTNNLYIASTNLSDAEQKIVTLVDDEMSRAKKLLEKVVNINSGTMNFAGIKQVGQIFIEELNEIGFDAKWIEGSAFNRAGHLFAARGDRGIKLLLIGHLDTVFASDSSFQKFQKLEGNKVTGPGIVDMKGGDVIIIQALRTLKAAGLLDEISVQVVMTGDEEKRGSPHSLANKVLIDSAKWADVAIGFENGDGNPKTLVVARRGSVNWALDVTGRPSHSSQIFQKDIGYGAVLETARILNSFREQLEPMPNLSFNPGVIVGGTDVQLNRLTSKGTAFGKSNVVAQLVQVSGGVRTTSPAQLADAKKKMQDIVDNNLLHTTAVLKFNEGYPAMAPRDSNYQLLSIYNRISLDLGFGKVVAVDPRKAGAADISFAADHVLMSVDGLGLMGKGGHTINETADMATFSSQIKRAALLMHRLGKGLE